MQLLGNIIFAICGGLIAAFAYLVLGIVLCVTIIGIPFGLQCFKCAKLSLAPFGKEVVTDFDSHPVANIIWAVLVGWSLWLSAILSGIVLCVTIVGIPFGLQAFKFAKLGITPFGAEVI